MPDTRRRRSTHHLRRTNFPRALTRVAAMLAVCGSTLACRADPAAPPEVPAEPPSVTTDSIPLPDLGVPAAFGARYVVTLTDLATAARVVRLCSGSFQIERQEGASFTGRFAVAESVGCAAADAGVVAGTLFRYGDVAFDLQVPGAGRNQLPASIGCAYAADGGRFTGAVNEKKLVAISQSRVRCPTAGGAAAEFDLRVRIDAGRLLTARVP